MDHELTAKWHELDKIQIGLKDAVVLQPDLSAIQSQIGDLADLTTEAKDNLVAAINEAAQSGGSGSGTHYRIGSGLKLDPATHTLSVDAADAAEQDNTKPITSAAVYAEVGNINALLATL